MELQSSRQLHKVSLPDCSVVSAAFIPIYGDNSIAQLYFVDSQQKLICYGPKQESADSEVSVWFFIFLFANFRFIPVIYSGVKKDSENRNSIQLHPGNE